MTTQTPHVDGLTNTGLDSIASTILREIVWEAILTEQDMTPEEKKAYCTKHNIAHNTQAFVKHYVDNVDLIYWVDTNIRQKVKDQINDIP